MKPHQMHFTITSADLDNAGHVRPGTLLFFAQEAAGAHCALLGVDRQALEPQHLFWAVVRHKAEIVRLPGAGETVTVETWPMPTTRTAFPRSTVGYDAQGKPLFRIISLWVLMDTQTRTMVLPGKSGICVDGFLQGGELTPPGTIPPKPLAHMQARTVTNSDLDSNQHLNNARYLDWIWDLLPDTPCAQKNLREFSICYLSEARLGQELTLAWELSETGALQVEGHRAKPDSPETQGRVFAASLTFK